MINELRKKSNKELGNLIIQMRSQLLEYRFKDAMGELTKPHYVKLAKKTIAMCYTILRERNVDLLISANDHALVEYKDGKRIVTSIRDNKPEPVKQVKEVKKEEPVKEQKPVEPKKEVKPAKPKMVDGIEVGKKHVQVKMSELAIYNYEKRRAQWKKHAGYNEEAENCSICKKPKHSSILTDTGKHICYICFIKKFEFEKNNKMLANSNINVSKNQNATKTRMIRNQSKG